MGRLRKKAVGWGVRLRYGQGLDEWFSLIAVSHDDEPLAKARLARLQAMANRLKAAGRHAEARVVLEEAAAAKSETAFRAVEAAVAQLTEGAPEPAAPRTKAVTFRDVVEQWTSGKLAERFPDEVATKIQASRDADLAILSTFYPALGHRPIAEITSEEAEKAKQLIPASLEHSTRRNYTARLRFIFKLAEQPLKLIEHSPIGSKFVARRRARHSFAFIYPEEEARLLACTGIPFEYRWLYGWLARNGSRISETLRLTWQHISLESGTVRLEASWTKTKRARLWRVDADVLIALQRRWRDEGEPVDALVFPGPAGRRLTRKTVRQRFRRDLERAEVKRAELHARTEDSRPLRVHDLRASFVTLALANGWTEQQVMDRSGHETSVQLAVYRRHARHAAELSLGWFHDLHDALPELRESGQSLGQWVPKAYVLRDSAQFISNRQDPTSAPADAGKQLPSSSPDRAGSADGPAEIASAGQGLAQPEKVPEAVAVAVSATVDSPVEQALAAALTAAMGREQWDLAQSIVNEIGERRRARTAPSVPILADARAKKRDGEGK